MTKAARWRQMARPGAGVDPRQIDRSFVAELGTGGRDAAIVSAIAEMSRALGARVVAEGVETEEQLRGARKLGCELAQGSLFSRPRPAGRDRGASPHRSLAADNNHRVSPGQPSVAVLGTGIMGGPMAKNIAGAGLETRAWNRTREKAEELGLPVADSPSDAVEGVDIVVTMLADGAAVESVMIDGGALQAMRDDAVWLQASTVGIAATERLAQLAGERGVTYVDAPVLGTKAPAENGELTVLASGPDGALDTCEPVFDAIGSKTVRLGEAGAGTRLKLVINNWLLSLLGDLAETVAFAERLGVEPERFLEAIDGPTGSPYAQMKGPMMIKREFPTSFPLKLALKDLELVLEAAERHDADMRVAGAAAENFRRAVDRGHGDEDMAAVFFANAD